MGSRLSTNVDNFYVKDDLFDSSKYRKLTPRVHTVYETDSAYDSTGKRAKIPHKIIFIWAPKNSDVFYRVKGNTKKCKYCISGSRKWSPKTSPFDAYLKIDNRDAIYCDINIIVEHNWWVHNQSVTGIIFVCANSYQEAITIINEASEKLIKLKNSLNNDITCVRNINGITYVDPSAWWKC